MNERTKDWLEDIKNDLAGLQGDIIWMSVLLEQMEGEAGLYNLRRARDYICGHAQGLAISARKLVETQESMKRG